MTNTKLARKQMTASDYDDIKKLLGLGVTPKMVAEVANRGVSTIVKIKSSDSFEQYLERNRISRDKHLAKTKLTDLSEVPTVTAPEATVVLEPAKTVTVPSDVEDGRTASRTVRALERIADATERLANAWEAAPEKKGLFR